jgi:hypothetical protein
LSRPVEAPAISGWRREGGSAAQTGVGRQEVSAERGERLDRYRFSQVRVEADTPRLESRLPWIERRESDEAGLAVLGLGAHASREFEPIHPWHPQVAQDQVGRSAGELVEPLPAVRRKDDASAEALQHDPGDGAMVGIIFHDQDNRAREGHTVRLPSESSSRMIFFGEAPAGARRRGQAA